MAKHKKKSQNKWQPKANDAINLAAIHWFAITLEAKAIEIYGTNPGAYPNLEAALRKAVAAVAAVDAKKPIAGDDDCPPGWVQCGSDCAPMCFAPND